MQAMALPHAAHSLRAGPAARSGACGRAACGRAQWCLRQGCVEAHARPCCPDKVEVAALAADKVEVPALGVCAGAFGGDLAS
jgi:hypothetical protein